MTGEITITVTTTLTAADVFRIIIGFSRVWFTCINSAVHCEFPIPSESLHLRDENSVPTIHTEAELEKDPSIEYGWYCPRCKKYFVNKSENGDKVSTILKRYHREVEKIW